MYMIWSQFFKACSVSALLVANHFQLCLFLLVFASRFLVLCVYCLFFFLVFGFIYFKLWKIRIRFAIMNPPLIAPNTHTHTPHTHTQSLSLQHTHTKDSPHNLLVCFISQFSVWYVHRMTINSVHSWASFVMITFPVHFFSSCLLSVSIFFFGLLCFLWAC